MQKPGKYTECSKKSPSNAVQPPPEIQRVAFYCGWPSSEYEFNPLLVINNFNYKLVIFFSTYFPQLGIEDFPHHLGLIDLDWGGYICGASNIAPRWAISAAHCLEWNVPAILINLWGGSTSIISGGIIFFVDQYILHPQYDDWTLNNDIAVLQVSVSSSTNFS